MAANSANRKYVRKAFAALLSAQMTGVGKPGQVLYNHRAGDEDWGSDAPATVVMTGGSERIRDKPGQDTYEDWFHFNVVNYVPYPEASETPTLSDVEDKLDDMEKVIADVIMDNESYADGVGTYGNAGWEDMQFDGKSIPDDIKTEKGKWYAIEIFPIKAHIFQG